MVGRLVGWWVGSRRVISDSERLACRPAVNRHKVAAS